MVWRHQPNSNWCSLWAEFFSLSQHHYNESDNGSSCEELNSWSSKDRNEVSTIQGKASLTMPPKIKRIQTQILILLTNSCFRYRCHIHVCCTDQSKMVQTHTGALVFAFATQVGGRIWEGGNVLTVTGAGCLKFAFSIVSFHDIWGQKHTDKTLL